MTYREKELPMLAAIGGMLRWVEELANIAAGPLLTVGLGIALVDLLTDGKLLTSWPALLLVWAVSMAIGVDAQLVGSAAKAAAAIRARRPWALLGYLLLVCVLAYVAYVASLVFATQEANGITTAAALSRLGMDSTSWLWQRSALAVLLVVLSGFLRYVPPSAEASAEDERAKLAREMELEPLRAELRARRAIGWRDVGKAITQGTTATVLESTHTHAQVGAGSSESEPPRRPPTGPGSPAQAAPGSRGANTTPRSAPLLLRLDAPPTATKRRAAARASGSSRGAHPRPGRAVRTATVEAQARAAWQPGMSVSELQRAAQISRNAAGKWRKVLTAEAAAAAAVSTAGEVAQ